MTAGVASTCVECEGKRFQAEVLEYTFGGKDISEVLAMPATQAEEFFASGEAKTPAAHKILTRLVDVGDGATLAKSPPTKTCGHASLSTLAASSHTCNCRSAPLILGRCSSREVEIRSRP
jgi:excinuclease UvrABC ATPase subunit